MKEAADGERFEEAARYRNRLFSVLPPRRTAGGRQPLGRDLDVIGIVERRRPRRGPTFPLRDGRLIDRYAFHLENVCRAGHRRPAQGFRRSSTTARRPVSRPRSSCPRDSGDTPRRWRSSSPERRGSRVEVRAPARGEKRRLGARHAERAAWHSTRGSSRSSASGCAGSRRWRSCARR